MRRRPRLILAALPPVPVSLEEHPAHLRLWTQPAGHLEPRPVWEVIVSRESTPQELKELEVRIAWDLRVPLDEAVTWAEEVRRRLRAGDG